MGRQIALNAALHGFEAVVYDISAEACEKIVQWKDDYLAGRISKGRLTQAQVSEADGRFGVSADLKEAVKGADLIIECIWEREDAKRKLFKELDQLVGEDVIMATNSSYMVSSTFADCIRNPVRLANCHFYNPALVMEFVEVVKGPHTSEETAETLMAFCRACGKDPILMRKEIEGFAANRIVRAVNKEARYLVQNGYLTPQEIDKACEKGLRYPMGPFHMNDFTGLDLTLDTMKETYAKTGIKPDCYDVVEKMVSDGRLGRKSGHGFYDYE